MLHNKLLYVNWNSLNNFVDIDEAMSEFSKILHKTLDNCIPIISACMSDTSFPEWFNKTIPRNLK